MFVVSNFLNKSLAAATSIIKPLPEVKVDDLVMNFRIFFESVRMCKGNPTLGSWKSEVAFKSCLLIYVESNPLVRGYISFICMERVAGLHFLPKYSAI